MNPRLAALPLALCVAALGGATACGKPGLHTREGGAVVASLAVRVVDWNPTHAPMGKVRAVADTGDTIAVFSDEGAAVLSGGAVLARDLRITTWASAGVIPGADGLGRWIAGVSADGHLYRLRASTVFEDVSARYGLGQARARSLAMLDDGHAAFALDGEVAIADGSRVTRTKAPGLRELRGGGGLGVGTLDTGLLVLDVRRNVVWQFPLEGITHAAVDGTGRLYATTARALYASEGPDRLSLVYDAGADRIRGLVVSGDAVWLIDGTELAVLENGRLLETTGARVGEDAALASSPTGDVWVRSHETLSRFARQESAASLSTRWQREVAPVFGRACAACHLPDGPAGIDLSTAERWMAKRDLVQKRVVSERSMPPNGHSLSDADRARIEHWAAP